MVTRIVTRRIISSEERAAAAAKDSDRDDVNRWKDNKQSDDDDKKHGSNGNEAGGGGGGAQKLCNFKSSQSKAAYRGICDVRSSYHDVFFNDDTATDDGKAVDIQRDSSTPRKRPLLPDDADDDEEGKHRKKGQKFIDLSDVPPKLPIISSRKGATSKYRGVYLHKATNKWRARIMIDGKQRNIGYYDTDKEAAVDYARARLKYNKV